MSRDENGIGVVEFSDGSYATFVEGKTWALWPQVRCVDKKHDGRGHGCSGPIVTMATHPGGQPEPRCRVHWAMAASSPKARCPACGLLVGLTAHGKLKRHFDPSRSLGRGVSCPARLTSPPPLPLLT